MRQQNLSNTNYDYDALTKDVTLCRRADRIASEIIRDTSLLTGKGCSYQNVEVLKEVHRSNNNQHKMLTIKSKKKMQRSRNTKEEKMRKHKANEKYTEVQRKRNKKSSEKEGVSRNLTVDESKDHKEPKRKRKTCKTSSNE